MTALSIIMCIICGLGANAERVSANQNDPYDSYGDVAWEIEKAHLDNFALFLDRERDMNGYIVAYAGRRSCKGDAKKRALRAKQYVISRGIEARRIKWIDGGFREEFTVVLQPAEHNLPAPVHPTLKRKEVRVINCKPKVRAKP